MPAGSLGAAATLLIIMVSAGRGGFSPHRMLLAGMALSTAFTMLLMMMQASGDPRMTAILTWISGSTYNASGEQVWRTSAMMVVLLALTPLCRRWLMILPLGGDTARAMGMALTSSRVALLLLAAALTATATMTIGPLSFVGLMAPHIARMMGFRRTMPHMLISALVGGVLLVFADWCGRMMLFPYQIPGGAAVDLYWRAVLYLFAEKAEPLIFSLSLMGRGKRTSEFRECAASRIDSLVDIFFAVCDGHEARFKRRRRKINAFFQHQMEEPFETIQHRTSPHPDSRSRFAHR